MKSERETLEMLAAFSGEQLMSKAKKLELWDHIEARIDNVHNLSSNGIEGTDNLGERIDPITASRFSMPPNRLASRRFSRLKVLTVAVASVIIVAAGALYLPHLISSSTTGRNGHPDYAILTGVPVSQQQAVKKEVRQKAIKNLEFPTILPYAVTTSLVQDATPPAPHSIAISFAGAGRAVMLDAHNVSKDYIITQKSVSMDDERATHLTDGTEAFYGNNGHISELVWVKNQVEYDLMSTKKGNEADLTEQQLIQVADAFR